MAFINFRVITCVFFLILSIFANVCPAFATDDFYWWYQDNISKYVYPYSDDFSDWCEMRKAKKAQRGNMGQTKQLYLLHGKFPLFQEQNNSLEKMVFEKKLKSWALDPDGNIAETALLKDKKGFYVLIPGNLNLRGGTGRII